MKKGQKHSAATRAKMAAAKIGNQNALGHSVPITSLFNLARGNRRGKRMSPNSLANLVPNRPKKPARRPKSDK